MNAILHLDWAIWIGFFSPVKTKLSTVLLGQGVSQDLKDAFLDVNII